MNAAGVITWVGASYVFNRKVTVVGAAAGAIAGLVAITPAAGFVTVGGALIAWEDPRTGTEDIYIQRLSMSGSPQWTADGVAVCTAAERQQECCWRARCSR